MDKTVSALILSVLIGSMIFAMIGMVSADVTVPTTTKVYFEKNGQPYNQPVEYTIKCYGYSWSPGPNVEKAPGTYNPEVVFSFSASYKNYGDKIYENYYTNYRHIDYCNLEGETNGENFVIEKYADYPISDCKDIELPIEKNGKYYKSSDEYKECINNSTYSTEHCFQYLIECNKEESTWMINGKYYKRDPEGKYDDCQRKASQDYEQQKSLCDKYLIEIPESQIEKDDRGNELMMGCELRFDIQKKILVNYSIENKTIKKCVGEGETCGTIVGIHCCGELICKIDCQNCQDVAGICIKENKTCPENSDSENNKCYKTLSNGRKAEIKIMPETASTTAIARLGDLNFTIELKEVGKGDDTKVVYELTGDKEGKFLGIFKIMASEKVQVDAETGDVKIIKPWWSFLATRI